MRKDLELAQNALEMESETMRRRHQQTVAEMADQIEMLTKQKNKLVERYHILACVWIYNNISSMLPKFNGGVFAGNLQLMCPQTSMVSVLYIYAMYLQCTYMIWKSVSI